MSVAQLTSMGFSQEDAEQALQNHKTIEAAVEHLFSVASQPEADLQSVSQWLEQKEAASQAVAEDEKDTGDETAEKPASEEDAMAIKTAGEEKEAAAEAADEQEVDMIEKAASSKSLQIVSSMIQKAVSSMIEKAEVDEGIEHCHTCLHHSADLGHLSAAAPFEDDTPPDTQTIGGDDASRWARWIPVDAGTVDASSRATPWDRAQVLVSKSMSSLRMHVSERKQPEKDSSQNTAEEVAEASSVDSAEVETQEAAGDETPTLQAAAKWQEMVYKVSAVPAAKAQGAPDEPWDHAQVLLSKSMSALRTHTHPHVAKWREVTHKVSASMTSQSRMKSITPESSTDAVVAAAATVPEDEPVHNSPLDENTDVDAPLETAASVGAAAEGSDEAEKETAAAPGSRLEESSDVDALLDRAQVLWSQSACALRSQVTGLLQDRQTSMQEPSLDSAAQEVRTSHLMGEQAVANDKSQPSPDREEEAPAAAFAEADGIASPPNADAAPDGASTTETDREQAFENATRFDHAQVLLSVSMAALRQGISRIHASHPISVQ